MTEHRRQSTASAAPDAAKRPPRRAPPGAAKARSRSGCLTCKTKHIKCDETRPACKACTRKGLQCGGYSRELKWSYKHQPGPIDPFVNHFAEAARNSQAHGEDVSSHEQDEDVVRPSAPQVGAAASPLSALLPMDINDDIGETLSLGLFDAMQPWSGAGPNKQLQPLFMPNTSPVSNNTPPQSPKSAIREAPDPSLEAARYLLHVSPMTSGPDTTLVLISSWFDQVCPAWSGFDSGVNLNRKLASDLWHNSAAVFNSLQSMSASFLSARLPQMKQPALSLMKTATVCIQEEVSTFKGQSRLDSFPTGLLFSLFCLGTTVCWLDSSRLGIPFLREARTILHRLGQQFTVKTSEDRELLSFFKKSLVYWEMLLAVAGDHNEMPLNTNDIMNGYCIGPAAPEKDDDSTVDNILHPWTGISTLTSDLFARSIRLCRAFRANIARRAGTVRNAASTLQYIQEAQRLEEQLLELEFSTISQNNDTGDERTPWNHLARVAEAYQVASLLQLYETFPDLVSLRLPLDSVLSEDGVVPWEKWVIPLTLRLIEILQDIPPDSGSRVIQPLLYICAGTGLRYNLLGVSTPLSSQHQQQQHVASGSGDLGQFSLLSGLSSGGGTDLLDYIAQIDTAEADTSGPNPVSHIAVSISNARNFVMKRLNILESTLQPKPVIVAKELVKAVWAAYDDEPPGSTATHWLDVMESGDLRSLFG